MPKKPWSHSGKNQAGPLCGQRLGLGALELLLSGGTERRVGAHESWMGVSVRQRAVACTGVHRLAVRGPLQAA